jgi:hypothetical protein
LLFSSLLSEVENNSVTLSYFLVSEEVVKEVLELSHSGSEEFLRCVAEGLLGWEIRETIVSLHVELLLNERLELSHGRVSISDVESDVAWCHYLNEVLSI